MPSTSKTIVITGATNGIGFCAAQALANLGHHVVLHGRDPHKGAAALASIRRQNPEAKVDFLCADLASLAQVRELAERIKALPRLDMLINNAGAMFFTRQESQDGYEATFAVNHLAPFLLTQLLLEKLAANGQARIINVASNAHKRAGPLNFADLMSTQKYAAFAVYCRSKLANVLFTSALARRLTGRGITVNCLHPGVVRTGFGHNSGPLMRIALWIAGRIFMISPEAGAKTIIHLATAEPLLATGEYFVRCAPAPTAAFAQDINAQEQLWARSCELVGLPVDQAQH